ncbi:hypothetical protein BV898_03546 [Hypsibius exemplaris]|uniref:Bulb-type lectin domain-containing protein n=1 Tax=Hypsibius exemplaris TaxID=2072580 RepID=A0A1W0X561_HYPEX|nr:hypothetical protein BV898_03546 [Hypsibius exemplaris]
MFVLSLLSLLCLWRVTDGISCTFRDGLCDWNATVDGNLWRVGQDTYGQLKPPPGYSDYAFVRLWVNQETWAEFESTDMVTTLGDTFSFAIFTFEEGYPPASSQTANRPDISQLYRVPMNASVAPTLIWSDKNGVNSAVTWSLSSVRLQPHADSFKLRFRLKMGGKRSLVALAAFVLSNEVVPLDPTNLGSVTCDFENKNHSNSCGWRNALLGGRPSFHVGTPSEFNGSTSIMYFRGETSTNLQAAVSQRIISTTGNVDKVRRLRFRYASTGPEMRSLSVYLVVDSEASRTRSLITLQTLQNQPAPWATALVYFQAPPNGRLLLQADFQGAASSTVRHLTVIAVDDIVLDDEEAYHLTTAPATTITTTTTSSVSTPRHGLQAGEWLGPDAWISAPNGAAFLIMELGGDLVVYKGSNPQNKGERKWSSGTGGRGPSFLIMHPNCNLKVYQGTSPTDMGSSIWQTNTANRGGNCTAQMQNDTNFVVYKSGSNQALWSIYSGLV